MPNESDSDKRKFNIPNITNSIFMSSDYDFPYLLEPFFKEEPEKIHEKKNKPKELKIYNSEIDEGKDSKIAEELNKKMKIGTKVSSLSETLELEKESIVEEKKIKPTKLLEQLFSFLNTDEKLNSLLSGYFYEIVTALIRYNSQFMIEYIFSIKQPLIYKHCYNNSICGIMRDLFETISDNAKQLILLNDFLTSCLIKYLPIPNYSNVIFMKMLKNMLASDKYFDFFSSKGTLKTFIELLDKKTIGIVSEIFLTLIQKYKNLPPNVQMKYEHLKEGTIELTSKMSPILTTLPFENISNDKGMFNSLLKLFELINVLILIPEEKIYLLLAQAHFPRIMLSILKKASMSSMIVTRILTIFKFFLRSKNTKLIESYSFEINIAQELMDLYLIDSESNKIFSKKKIMEHKKFYNTPLRIFIYMIGGIVFNL